MKIKLDLIQMLRGIMAIIVVLHHITGSYVFYLNHNWLNGIFSVGWVGVDFFFVLSGFIMVYAHKEDYVNRTNIVTFFKKRFLRIYPIYWVIASISLCLMLVSHKLSLPTDGSYILKSLLLIPDTKAPFLIVAWSLIFECFFYLVFGIGIYFGVKVMKYFFLTWLVIIIVSNFITLPTSNLFIFNNFILEFIFGCIVGYLFAFNSNTYNFKPATLIWVGCIILVAMWIVCLNSNFGLKQSIESRLVYGLSASLIILGLANLSTQNKVKTAAIFLLLGNASYVLYLIHPIVLAVVFKASVSFLNKYDSLVLFFGVFVFLICLTVGIFFHLMVEKPLMKKLNSLLFSTNKIA